MLQMRKWKLGDLAKTTEPQPGPVDSKACGVINHHIPDLWSIFDHGLLSFITPTCYPKSSVLFIYSLFIHSI